MSAECLVSARDYRRYWGKKPKMEPDVPIWSGIERRVSGERRRSGHERRWNQEKGRRYRLVDRRKGARV